MASYDARRIEIWRYFQENPHRRRSSLDKVEPGTVSRQTTALSQGSRVETSQSLSKRYTRYRIMIFIDDGYLSIPGRSSAELQRVQVMLSSSSARWEHRRQRWGQKRE